MDDQIKIIIERYFLGKASEEEIQQLNLWYNSCDDRPSILDSFTEGEKKAVSDKMFSVISAVIEKYPDAVDEQSLGENDIPAFSKSSNAS